MRRLLIALCIVSLITACGDGGNGPNGDFTVEVTPTTAEVFSAAPGNSVALTVIAKDDQGQPIAGGTTSFASSNNSIATVSDAGTVTGVAAGTTQITASVTVSGRTASATTSVTVQDAAPAATVRAPAFVFSPGTVDVRAGGIVTWTMEDIHHTVDFQTAGAPSDIGELTNASESRTFPTSGTFSYRCTIHAQMAGVVRVH